MSDCECDQNQVVCRDCDLDVDPWRVPDGWIVLGPSGVEKVRTGLRLIQSMPDVRRNPDGVNQAVAECRLLAAEMDTLFDGRTT